MKLILLLIIIALTASGALAGRVKDMTTNDPQAMLDFIRTANYSDLLQFVRDADAERIASPNDGILEYAWVAALSEAALDKQIPLNLDVTLTKTDLPTRTMGVRAIYRALVKGAQLDQSLRDRLLTKLK